MTYLQLMLSTTPVKSYLVYPLVVNSVLSTLENFSEQIDTADVLEGWREKYKLADDSTKLEYFPSRIIQSARVVIVFSSIAINLLSDIPPEAFINI